MLVTKVSLMSGVAHTMELPVTQDQIDVYKAGALVQDAFPNLTASEREFFMTGITDAEWDGLFPDE